jgi:Spy/CpxP family protein refolding chaperone
MKTTKLILSFLLLLSLFAAPLVAQPNKNEGMDEHHKKGIGMGIPGLSEEQGKKIDALRISFQKEMLSLKNQMSELKAHQKTLSTADKVDMKAIYANIDAITQVQNQMMKKGADHRQQVRSILTDEQRLRFDLKSDGRKGFRKMGHKVKKADCSGPDCKNKCEGIRAHATGGKCPNE